MNANINAPKPWFTSKGAWLNIVIVVAGLGDVVAPYQDVVRQALGPHWFSALMIVIGFAGLIVRQLTAGGLTMTKPPNPPETAP